MRRLSLLLLLALTVAACDSSEDDVARADSTVTVAYEGRLADGTVFDRRSSASFSLQGVVPGFRDGIVGMRVGESRTFDVPPELGYGSTPRYDREGNLVIPPNSTLTFDVTLLDVQ